MAANSKLSPSAGYPHPKFKPAWSALATLVGLFLAAAPSLHAEEPSVTLKLDIVAWGDAIPGLSLKSEKGNHPITAESFTYSNPVSYSGPVIMEIYQNASDPAASEKTNQQMRENGGQSALKPKPAAPKATPTPTATASADPATPKSPLALELERRRKDNPNLVALARIPAACSRATVLLAPAENGTFDAFVLDDDSSKLPLGKLRVQNLSPHTVAVRFQTTPPMVKELKTKESVVIPAARDHVIYELAYQLGNEWKFQENNIVKVRPNEQTQMIVLRSMNSYFASSDGSISGFLQLVTLRRNPK